MNKNFSKIVASAAMAAIMAFSSVAAQADEFDEYDDLYDTENLVDYETYLTWGIDEFAERTKNSFKATYPDMSETIDAVVDAVTGNDEFALMFESGKEEAFQIVEETLRNVLEPSMSFLDQDEETYFSAYSIDPIKQESAAKNAAAATLMALNGSGVTGYTQTNIYNLMNNDTTTQNTMQKITNVLKNKISAQSGYSVMTRAFASVNRGVYSLIDCLSSALVADTVPVIQLDNKYLNGGTSEMRYLVVTCVDTVAEDITLYDPDTNSSARRYLSYSQLENILCQTGAIFVSTYGIDNNQVRLAAIKSEFPEGSYFNKTGTPCTCHNDNTIDCRSGLCDCKKVDDCVQCMGFANYVYDNVKGKIINISSRQPVNKAITEDSAKKYLKGLSMGTHVRLNKDGHSIALLSTTEDTITFAQANWGGKCLVTYKTLSWSQFASTYYHIDWYVV